MIDKEAYENNLDEYINQIYNLYKNEEDKILEYNLLYFITDDQLKLLLENGKLKKIGNFIQYVE